MRLLLMYLLDLAQIVGTEIVEKGQLRCSGYRRKQALVLCGEH